MLTPNALFTLQQLTLRDFKIRYRNMSLGFVWSLLNPAIMVLVFSFVFTQVFPNPNIQHFPVFVLCGILLYNFYCLAWVAGTQSLTGTGAALKRVRVPRMLVPLSAVLANSVHLLLQFAVFIPITLVLGVPFAVTWLWLPIILALLLIEIAGLALLFSILDVRLRDTRYLVESFNLVLFWLTPIFYKFEQVPAGFADVLAWAPVTPALLALRQVLIDGTAPDAVLIFRLVVLAVASAGVGLYVFRQQDRTITDYL